MPAHTLEVTVTVVYSGTELTEEEKQAAADAAAQAARDYVAGAGKGVLNTEGIVIQA